MIRINSTKEWPNTLKLKVTLGIISLIIAFFFFQQKMMAQNATEYTQVLNYGQLVEQRLNQLKELANEMQMIQNQIEQLKSVANYQDSWEQISAVAGNVSGIIQQSENISNAVNLDFTTMQNNDATLTLQTNLFAQQSNWRNATNQSVTGALSTVNAQNQSINQENQELQLLLAKNNGAVGETQALQTLNVLMAQLVNQMQLLRQLSQAQINMQSAYINQEIAEKQKVDTTVNAMFQPFPNEQSATYEMSNSFFSDSGS